MILDIFFLIFVGWGLYKGFSAGIIKTIFTVLSFLIGLIAAFKLAPAATRFLETAFSTDHPLMFAAGFLLAFFVTMLVIRLLAQTLESFLEKANLNILNQLAGAVLMGSLFMLMLSILVWFGDKAHLIDEKTREASLSYPILQQTPREMRKAYEFCKPVFQDFWTESIEFLDRLEELEAERTESQPTIFDLPPEEEQASDEEN
ncbi:MAG: hypothetical protein D6765_06005 [Bacteroidetes bacterium]|nr:MAG: hypothetical protein D6765_06005 [Bacteroidota bacterium]